MKEMIYEAKRCNAKQLVHGTWQGFDYYVLSLGTHPCAYVDISRYQHCKTLRAAIEAGSIGCHGGITYNDSRLATVEHEGWFIGWDYCHSMDYSGSVPNRFVGLKRWTTDEMVRECKCVINQIIEKIIVGETLRRYLELWNQLQDFCHTGSTVSPVDITEYVNNREQFLEMCRGDATFCSKSRGVGMREYGKIFGISVYVDWTPEEAIALFGCCKY